MADKNTLLALNTTNLPDNATEEISPADVREVNEQVINSNANLDELTEQEFLGSVKFSGGVEGIGINNRIIINEFSDFPEPMLADTQYYIGGSIVMPDTLPASWLDLPNNIEFKGSVVSSKITWNGTGSLFNGGDMERFRVVDVLLDAPNGQLYNITDTSSSTIVNLLTASVVACDSFGNINAFAVIIDLINCNVANDGLVLGDKTVVLSVNRFAINSADATFVAVDIEDCIISTLEITNLRSIAPSGAFAFKGVAGGVNIATGQVGDISSCEFSGGITTLSGIVDGDSAFEFNKVTGVKNSKSIGHAYIAIGDEVTTIINSGVEVPVAGVFTQGGETSGAEVSAAGVITMRNRIEKRGTVTATLDIDKAGGGNDDYLFRIKKIPISGGGEVEVEGAFTTKLLGSGDSDQANMIAPVSYIDGDQFYVSVESSGTNDNITANTQGFEVSE